GSNDTVWRPGLHEVRVWREMAAGIDVMVTGGHDQVVLAMSGDILVPLAKHPPNLERHLGSAGNRQRSAFTEVVLNVGDYQCVGHRWSSTTVEPSGARSAGRESPMKWVGIAASPRDSCRATIGSSPRAAACRSRAVSRDSR